MLFASLVLWTGIADVGSFLGCESVGLDSLLWVFGTKRMEMIVVGMETLVFVEAVGFVGSVLEAFHLPPHL